MPIFGVDISRYQDAEAMDGYDFVIVNVEDPTLAGKIERAKNLGIPWGLYTWIYPGGRNDMARAKVQADILGDPPVGYWLDYEQAGVSPADLDAALDTAAELGIFDRTGVYTYLYQVATVADRLRGRPLWLAYYPGNNDGRYLADRDGDARAHGAVLWQYTSGANAPVGLDENVVINEAWYQAWIEGDDMGLSQEDKELLGGWMQDQTRLVVEHVDRQLFVSSVAIIDRVLKGIPAAKVDVAAIEAAVDAAMKDVSKLTADELARRLGD